MTDQLTTAKSNDNRRRVREWVESNPAAWSGWPTRPTLASDEEEQSLRLNRLARAGCPYANLRDIVDVVGEEVDAVRKRKRNAYVKRVGSAEL